MFNRLSSEEIQKLPPPTEPIMMDEVANALDLYTPKLREELVLGKLSNRSYAPSFGGE